jgi:hypothetical protein
LHSDGGPQLNNYTTQTGASHRVITFITFLNCNTVDWKKKKKFGWKHAGNGTQLSGGIWCGYPFGRMSWTVWIGYLMKVYVDMTDGHGNTKSHEAFVDS